MKEVVIVGCAMLTFLMAALHLLLLCGAPLGEYVLGGTNRVIPKPKRKLNVFFLVLFTFLGVIYLTQTSYLSVHMNEIIVKVLMILYTLFLAYAIVGNLFLTKSKKETLLMTPLSIIGCVSSIMTLIYIW